MLGLDLASANGSTGYSHLVDGYVEAPQEKDMLSSAQHEKYPWVGLMPWPMSSRHHLASYISTGRAEDLEICGVWSSTGHTPNPAFCSLCSWVRGCHVGSSFSADPRPGALILSVPKSQLCLLLPPSLA